MEIYEIFDRNLEQAKESIEKNCQAFLQQSNGLPLYRGMFRSDNSLIAPVRLNRRPSNTHELVQEAFDNWFKNNGFIANRSNSVFCTGNRAIARNYGTIYRIYPMGKFDITWSPVILDLFHRFDLDGVFDLATSLHKTYISVNAFILALKEKLGLEPTAFLKRSTVIENVMKYVDMEKFNDAMKSLNYQNTDLVSAINSNNEIMIHCEQYIAIKAASVLYKDSFS